MHKWDVKGVPDVGAWMYKHVHALHHKSRCVGWGPEGARECMEGGSHGARKLHLPPLARLSRSNPTAWSGVSMHPVESFMYYTAMLIPVYFGAHPIVMLYTKMDLTLAALIGHDGFGAPGAASPGHWLHHKLINVNVSRLRVACVGAGREAPLAKISISPHPPPPAVRRELRTV